MQVVLINPPTPKKEVWVREGRCQQFDIWGAPFPPLSLASIAGQLNNLAKAIIIDCPIENLSLETTVKKIKKLRPDLIIVSTTTPTLETDLSWFVSAVKKSIPTAKIAAIGIHVTALTKQTMEKYPSLDLIIMAEPELTAKELTQAIKKKQSLKSVSGLAYRNKKRVVINQPRPFIDDLDDLALPNWTGINFNNYQMPIKNRPFSLISFSRGCPFSCKFCNAHTYYGKMVRIRNPKLVVDEIEAMMVLGVCDFLFWTEFVTANKKYLISVLDEIFKRKLEKKIRWVANSRVDFVDKDILKLIKKSGCWQIVFGIEFGTNKGLRLSSKGRVNIKQSKKAVELAQEVGLVVDGHFILGYPGETEADIKKTKDFALRLPLTFAHFYTAVPFPGSTLYKEALMNNWIIDNSWLAFDQSKANMKTKLLNPEVVEEYILKSYRQFYLRPVIIKRILSVAKSPSELLNILKLGAKLITSLLS